VHLLNVVRKNALAPKVPRFGCLRLGSFSLGQARWVLCYICTMAAVSHITNAARVSTPSFPNKRFTSASYDLQKQARVVSKAHFLPSNIGAAKQAPVKRTVANCVVWRKSRFPSNTATAAKRTSPDSSPPPIAWGRQANRRGPCGRRISWWPPAVNICNCSDSLQRWSSKCLHLETSALHNEHVSLNVGVDGKTKFDPAPCKRLLCVYGVWDVKLYSWQY